MGVNRASLYVLKYFQETEKSLRYNLTDSETKERVS